MQFVNEDFEMEALVSRLQIKRGKGDDRIVSITMAAALLPGVVEGLPNWIQSGYKVAQGRAPVRKIVFDREVESQNVRFHSLPRQAGRLKEVEIKVPAVDLDGFEIVEEDGAYWLDFSFATLLGKELWDFLFSA